MATNAKQYRRPVTGRRPRIIALIAVGAACILLIVGAVVYRNTRPYEPPEWEPNAVTGTPTPPDGVGYGFGRAATENSFTVGLASVWTRNADGSLPVWLTNPAENTAYLLMRVRRASDGQTLYQSGLLRPGEYVENLPPLIELTDAPIEADVAIYSFDPETYHSLGTFYLTGAVG